MVFLFVGHYAFFAAHRQRYLTGRNLRLLASTSAQVGGALESAETVLHQHAKYAVGQYAEYAPDSLQAAAPFVPLFQHMAVFTDTVSRLGPYVGSCADSWPRTARVSGNWWEDEEGRTPCLYRTADGDPLQVSLNASTYLAPILRHPVESGVFEKTMLADARGRIMVQAGNSDLGLTRLDVILNGPSSSIKGSDGKGAETTAWERARLGPGITDVQIAGTTYRLFLQPCCLSPDGVARDAQLVVAGLVSRWAFVRSSLKLSLTVFMLISALLTLAVIGWPFLKLWLIGERQRVHLIDGVLLAISSVFTIALSTILLLDLYAYQNFRLERDTDLETLSDSIVSHMSQEVREARNELRTLIATEARDTSNGQEMRPNVLATSSRHSARFSRFESWSLIDSSGWQRRKWSVDRYVQPPIPVRSREYFQNVMQRRARRSPPDSGAAPELWTLESIRSWTTGKRQAVLSMAADAFPGDTIPVAAMALEMGSLIGAVLPPSFVFAVIDQRGTVLFHSDTSRNLEENLFAETDQNRPLKSAVFGRSTAMLDLQYGGLDHRAHVAPIGEPRWTLVTLRDKQPGRVANLEIVATSTYLIAFYVLALLIAGGVVLLFRPQYRAPWLWPDRRQSRAYTDLLSILGLFMVTFLVAIAALDGDDLLLAAVLLPAQVTVVVTLRLTRGEHELRALYEHLKAAWDADEGRLKRLMQADARLRRDLMRVGGGFVVPLVGVVLVLLGGGRMPQILVLGLTFLSTVWSFLTGDSRWGLRGSHGAGVAEEAGGGAQLRQTGVRRPVVATYRWAAMLFAGLIACLPAAAFFKVAHSTYSELLAKHVQLRFERDLDARRARIESTYSDSRGEGKSEIGQRLLCTKPTRECQLGIYHISAFTTDADSAGSGALRRMPLVALVSSLLYQPETSIEWRGLVGPEAGDRSWYRTRSGKVLSSHQDGAASDGTLKLATALPSLWPGTGRQTLGFAFPAALAIGVLVLVVHFLTRRLLLIDVSDPVIVTRHRRITPLADLNLFVLCQNCDEENTLDVPEQCEAIDLSQPAIHIPTALEKSRKKVQLGAPVFLKHFEQQHNDHDVKTAKAQFLHTLVRDYNCTVTVVSSRADDGSFRGLRTSLGDVLLGSEPPRSSFENTIGSFVPVDAGRWGIGRDDGDEWRSSPPEAPAGLSRIRRLILSESRNDRNLRKIWVGMERYIEQAAAYSDEPATSELLDLLGERAEAYYDTIWENSLPQEKVVLVHLAEDGLANEKDRRILRRLLIRGLIRRQPQFAIMNETFRRYLLQHAQAAEIEAPSPGRSVWDTIKVPGMMLLVSVAVFFFATQQELFTAANAVIMGVSTGIAGLLKVASAVGQRGNGGSNTA